MPADILSPQELLKQLNWRYAVKKFDAVRKIPAETWNTLEAALVLTPSSFGLQPWKFFVVQDPSLRQRLRPASWDQAQVTDASHLVVFAQKKDIAAADVEHFVQNIARVRKASVESLGPYKGMMLNFVNNAKPADIQEWAGRQLYIALGNFLTSAAVLGIDACPMEGIEPEKYDEILGIGQHGYHTRCVATAGYRASDDHYADLPKVRFPKQEVLVHL